MVIVTNIMQHIIDVFGMVPHFQCILRLKKKLYFHVEVILMGSWNLNLEIHARNRW